MKLLIVALFLPLFPFSFVLNGLLVRLQNPLIKCVLLLLWPQCGVLVLDVASQPIPEGYIVWSLISSALYALRLLTVRDLGRWAGFLASSALALTWVGSDGSAFDMHAMAFWFSVPSILLLLLAGSLSKRFGAAYAGLHGSTVGNVPRLTGLLVVAVLAAVATPPFPGFFAILALLHRTTIAPAILFIWLLWGWAAIKLIQGFLSGEECPLNINDLGRTSTLIFICVFGSMIFTGLYLTGGLL